jgi:hypothetical protein
MPGSHHNDIHDTVLELIRNRADLSRWSAANAHGGRMLEAVELLRAASDSEAPETLLPIVEKAIAAAVRVILRADDSSGIIGSAIHELLDLHAQLAPKVNRGWPWAATAYPPTIMKRTSCTMQDAMNSLKSRFSSICPPVVLAA